MAIPFDELVRLIDGRVDSSYAAASLKIEGAASVSEAQEGEITFFGNPKYLPALKSTKASVAIVPVGFSETIPAIPIEVENPSLAFSKVVEIFAPAPYRYPAGVHPSAVIGEGAIVAASASIQANAVVEANAEIGEGTVIGAGAVVCYGAKIGKDCHIHPNVTIRERCILGDRVIIHSGTTIGSDGFGYELHQGRHVKIPQIGIVQLDNDVEVGANTTIDRARFGRTWIGEGSKIDNLVQLAHNVVVGKHSLIVAQTGISGSTRVGNYVTIAGQVGVVGHIEIGDQSIIAAQSGISKSVKPKEVLWGTPATDMKETKERFILVGRLPKLFDKVKELEKTLAALSKKLGI